MDILLLEPPYASLKGMATDRGYNVGLTSLAAYLRHAGIDTAVLTGDLLVNLRRSLSRTLLPGMSFKARDYAAGQREYVQIVDDRTHPVWQTLADIVRQHKPRAVGISYLTPTKYATARVAALIREIDPDIRVIAGSFHPTSCPDEVMANPDIDFVVRGEGEVPLLRLMQEIKKDRPRWETVPGIHYRDGEGQVQSNPAANLIPNLDELPFLARDLVLQCDYNYYRLHAIATARGCPYTCSFCADRRLWGGKVRRRSVDNVLAELRHLKDTYRVSFVDIVDGTFTFDRKYVQAFCHALIDQDMDIKWRCTARYDNLDADLLDLMKRAHCSGLYFGLESGSDRILKAIDKKMTVAQMVRVSQMVHDSGIPMATSILLGLPDESKEEIEETLRLVKRIKTDLLDVNSFIPLPGAPLYDAMSEEERRNIDWHKVGLKSFDNYFSKTMSHDEFKDYMSEAYEIANDVRRRTIVRLGVNMLPNLVTRMFHRLR